MFFGLSADSMIEGVRLGRKDKDVFRNGNDVRIVFQFSEETNSGYHMKHDGKDHYQFTATQES